MLTTPIDIVLRKDFPIQREPDVDDDRSITMKRKLTPLRFLVLVLTLVAAACGDNTSEVGTASGADEPTAIESEDGEPPEELPVANPIDEEVITDFEPVDGKVTTPTEVVVNPDNPSELWVRFVGGAQPCTAANATVITETPDEVAVELVVGITSDALVKSCVAGEFNLRLDVELSEPATGKTISWTSAEPSSEPIQVTPDLTTDDFIGLTEQEAAAVAEENIITYRVVRIDDEFFAVTEDFNPGRLNFEIDNGVITIVTTG